MMRTSNVHRGVLLFGCAVILSVLNFMIFAKERIISVGASIYLALAPVDPRAILQGDYMTLRFELAAQIERDAANRSSALDSHTQSSDAALNDQSFRHVEITLDQNSIATLDSAKASHSLQIRYRRRGGQVWLGTNAFFFPEGEAARFERAKFGHFKLSKSTGEAILVGLVDEHLQAL